MQGMTELLQRAIAEIQKLSAEEQDAIAARILADLEDEQTWAAQFAATTDDQWARIADQARLEIGTGGTVDLDDFFPLRPAEA
jgi:hypothetical protein